MELHFLRHGLTVANVAWILQGHQPGELTVDQIKAFETIAFDQTGYDDIFCSPLKRCVDTAQYLDLNSLKLEPLLMERNFGVLEGKNNDEIEAICPEQFLQFRQLSEHFKPDKGESRSEHLQRLQKWLQEVSGNGFDKILAITHGGTIDFIYRMANGLAMHGGPELFVGENLGLTKIKMKWPHIELLEFATPVEEWNKNHAR